MNKISILIIDDEPQIRKLLGITLGSYDYKVLEAENAKLGIAMAANFQPDLILLDIGLPDKSGHEVLKELRTWYQHAILMLSVQNSEDDIVSALDAGATDYLVKPFRNAELLARIRAALRHNSAQIQTDSVGFGDHVLSFSARTLSKNGELVKLTAIEFKLLALLVKHQGRVLTHHFILKEIWGVGAQAETQYLRVFVASLRKKIEINPNKPLHIVTESGVGYRFK